MFFYTKRTLTVSLWVAVMVLGIMSYASWMRREGFPSVNVPVGIVQVVSFDSSAEQTDKAFVTPILKELQQDTTVKDVASTATNQGANIAVTFKEGTDVQKQLDALKAKTDYKVPDTGQVLFIKVNAGKLTNEGDDILVSVHGKGLSAAQLDAAAKKVAPLLQQEVSLAQRVRADTLVQPTSATDGVQLHFDRYFDQTTNGFQPSVIVAVKGVEGVDQLKLYDQVEAALESESLQNVGADLAISANFAEGIREQVSGLQQNLLEGLIVVLIVSFILISLRGSIITALAMTSTVVITVGLLHLFGYTLNTITLFALVLCLALIVDDTTIMVEVIDAGLKRGKKLDQVVQEAFKKVARASATGTAVTILAFAPMLFIGGILGQFIRAIPITIIISLVVSLVVSFVFIPIMMKLSYEWRTKKSAKANSKAPLSAMRPSDKLESAMGERIAKTILWSAKSWRHSLGMRLGAIGVSLAFIILGGFIFSKVEFNIFPSPKDGNDIYVTGVVTDKLGANIATTEKMTDQALAIVEETVGDNLNRVTLSGQGAVADRDGFTASVSLKPYGERSITSVEIAEQLQAKLASSVPGLRLAAEAAGVGPPAGAFTVQLQADNPGATYKLAADVKTFLSTTELKRLDGTSAKLKDVTVTPENQIVRAGSGRVVNVSAGFYDKDTTALVTLAQKAIEDKFTAEKLTSTYGVSKDTISFDFGQEDENQDSFSSMGKAAGPLFLAMFILMAILFGSVIQPLLIFTALPFALFGVAFGLYSTNNPISFFSMLGVFALIGISLNNTILLTDFANQAQKEGKKPAEAIAGAIRERLRPLLTTSLTSVFALLPLALNDPFWEGLAFALIFGLISSTILVLVVFPYFYLIAASFGAVCTKLFRRLVGLVRAKA